MSASWFLVSMYLIWILESRLIRSNNQSRATLWVLETCLIVRLLPFTIILITASLSLNTHNNASWCEKLDAWGNTINIVQNVDRSFRSLVMPVTFVTVHNGLHRSIVGLNCVSKDYNNQIPQIECGNPVQPQSCIQRDDFGFCWTVRSWSLFLTHPTYRAARNPFWINSPGPKNRIRIMKISESTVRFWTFEEKWKNNSSVGDFFETFWANSSGGFEGCETFFEKNQFFFHLSLHLDSSLVLLLLPSCLLSIFSSLDLLFSRSSLLFHLPSSLVLSFIFSLLFAFLSCLVSPLSSSLCILVLSRLLLSCLSFSLFSLHSCLVLSLLFPLLFAFLSCLVFSCLVLFCLLFVFSSLVSPLPSSPLSVPVFFLSLCLCLCLCLLCLCLSLSPCGVVVVSLCCVVSCVLVCVVVCVRCRGVVAVWCVHSKTSVCPFKTHGKFWTYTRARFEWTHGGFEWTHHTATAPRQRTHTPQHTTTHKSTQHTTAYQNLAT